MARFKKGEGGRPKGAVNKLTGSFKQAVLEAFNSKALDGVNGLIAWAAENRTDFYKIAARLIPAEVNLKPTGPRPLVIDRVATREQLLAAVTAQDADPMAEWDADDDGSVH